MKYKVEEITLLHEYQKTVFGTQIRYKIKKIKDQKILLSTTSKNEVENWLQENIEFPSDAILRTKIITEAIARAFPNPR